jgi:hypothetical protein
VVPLQWRRAEAGADAEPMDDLLTEIVDAENSDKWTLMHRFGAAAGVLDQIMQARMLSMHACIHQSFKYLSPLALELGA